jgi:Na+-translocating ferredoxin:NAD+ oxidoreductase RnfG subunit
MRTALKVLIIVAVCATGAAGLLLLHFYGTAEYLANAARTSAARAARWVKRPEEDAPEVVQQPKPKSDENIGAEVVQNSSERP